MSRDSLRRENEVLRERISRLSEAILRISARLDLDTRATRGRRYRGRADRRPLRGASRPSTTTGGSWTSSPPR